MIQRFITRWSPARTNCFAAGTLVAVLGVASAHDEVHAEPELVPIEDIQVGDRVDTARLADSPTPSATHVDSTWIAIDLEANTGATLTLLRPRTWLDQADPDNDRVITIDIPEFGLRTDAHVINTRPASIAHGTGRVVLATVRHRAGTLFELTFEDNAIEATASHPFFSLDRNDWVAAGDLQLGERIQTRAAETRLASRTRVPGNHPVYNLQIETDQEYLVGTLALRVHNTSPIPDEAFVVRGGVTTPVQIERGIGPHRNVPGLEGFSAQSHVGATVEELAATGGVGGGPFPHGQVSVSTAGKLRCIGCDVVRSPGGGANHVTVTPGPATPAEISAQFAQRPNPARIQ